MHRTQIDYFNLEDGSFVVKAVKGAMTIKEIAKKYGHKVKSDYLMNKGPCFYRTQTGRTYLSGSGSDSGYSLYPGTSFSANEFQKIVNSMKHAGSTLSGIIKEADVFSTKRIDI